MKPFGLLLASLGGACLLGCGESGVERLATQREAIVNGTLSSPKDDAVVVVSASGAGCTGTLIAPNVVLTALHCVAKYDPGFRFNCQSDGTLPAGSTLGQIGPTIEPQNVTVFSGVIVGTEGIHAKAIYGTGSTDACHDDLAVVVLESAPDIGNAPLVSVRLSRGTRKGELARVVGYGDVEQTDTSRGRQVRGDIVVRGVGGPDASSPGDNGVLPRTVQVGEGPCHGDSGGPLFSQETGAQVGVYSLLEASTCTGSDVRNSYTRIAPFEPLIRMALESVGAEPIAEPDELGGSAGEASLPGLAGSGGAGSSGGSQPIGVGDTPTDEGSGSIRDSSCALRAVGKHGPAPWMFVSTTLIWASWTAGRRRQRSLGRAERSGSAS